MVKETMESVFVFERWLCYNNIYSISRRMKEHEHSPV